MHSLQDLLHVQVYKICRTLYTFYFPFSLVKRKSVWIYICFIQNIENTDQTDRSVLNLVHVQNVNIRTCHFENTCYSNVIAKIAWSMKAETSENLRVRWNSFLAFESKELRSARFGGKTSTQSRYLTVPGGAEDPQFFFFLRGQLYPWYGGYSEYSLIMRLQVQHEVKGPKRWRTTWGRRRTWRSTWRTFT